MTAGRAVCAATGKRQFESKHSARAASKGVGNRIRVYVCPECGFFHITSQAEGKQAA